MTYEELLEILAEQFSCDEEELVDDLELAELGADHEDLIELAWNIGGNGGPGSERKGSGPLRHGG